MAKIKLKCGNGIAEAGAFQAGTVYLDLNTFELYIDDPTSVAETHQKIIDIDTLVYEISNSISDPFAGSSSRVGYAKADYAKVGMII